MLWTRLDRRTVLLIDEAGMIDTRQLGRILDHARDNGAWSCPRRLRPAQSHRRRRRCLLPVVASTAIAKGRRVWFTSRGRWSGSRARRFVMREGIAQSAAHARAVPVCRSCPNFSG